jgi:endonuclease/exonuclease/phosphatase family metal-dependent hydrolase
VRSKLLAEEIASEKPDVVGLQEVALWRSGPLELTKVGVPNAETVDYDFLATLTADLAAAGADYDVVHVQQESDVEGPAFEGSPFAGTMQDPRDARLTMRDVMLVRGDHGLKVLASGGAQYKTRLPVDVGGVPFVFIRGFNWADVKAGSMTVRVVNTHLESASSDIALGQAMELVNGPAKSPHSSVIVCDCNSDPLDHSVKPTDPMRTPHSGPYDYIVGRGFTDAWLQWKPANQGWTSGLSELVNDPTPAGFDHRIDMVFAKTASGSPVVVDRGTVTGDELSDRDPATGLWPSDHAGVVLRLRGLK